jgi:hypothetical protein
LDGKMKVVYAQRNLLKSGRIFIQEKVGMMNREFGFINLENWINKLKHQDKKR